MFDLMGGSDFERIGVLGILNSLADGAYVTDVDRRILFWNGAAERITGWLADDVEGMSCRDNILVHVDKDGHELCGQEYCPLHRAIVTGHASEKPLLVFAKHKCGDRIPVEVSVAPLRSAAGQIVGGIEIFRDRAELTHDLWRARAIQEHAMQSDFPSDARLDVEIRYTPEEIVGGDFYHAGRLDDGRLAMMLADVMGHGVASALYGVQLRLLWDELRGDLARPAVFMADMNRRLTRLAARDGYFATAVLILLDPEDGRMEWVRAGHPPPLLVDASGAVTPLEGGQPALGLVGEVEFKARTGRIPPRGTLLLYTDGAMEIVNAAGTELGEEGLAALVARQFTGPDGLSLAKLEEGLLAYGNGLRLADDLTLIRITRR